MTDEANLLLLPEDDFRRVRSYYAPHVFASWRMDDPNEPDLYPPPSDLVSRDDWVSIIQLPTDVVLKTTSYAGSWVSRIEKLASDWLWAMPCYDQSPLMAWPSVVAREEFKGLVFNAVHGYFRQALGCLRNVLEILAAAASVSITNNNARYEEWRDWEEVPMRQARPVLRDSVEGTRIDSAVADPDAIFGDDKDHWMKRRYKRLCAYTHGAAGHTSGDFWESNGPIYVSAAFPVVEAEFRETLALSFLLLKIGWPGYTPTDGVRDLLSGPATGWEQYHAVLSAGLL